MTMLVALLLLFGLMISLILYCCLMIVDDDEELESARLYFIEREKRVKELEKLREKK